MNLLLVAATETEIEPTLTKLSLRLGPNISGDKKIHILITGVGMVATAFHLGKTLAKERFDLALNIGIAGSFNRHFDLGELVNIEQDSLAELGAEDDERFLTLDVLGFGSATLKPIISNLNLDSITKVKAITVNKVHGNEDSIKKTLGIWDADVESMEGAAFFYSCNQYNLPSVQVRAISNYVEKRNRAGWEIALAVKNINLFLTDFIQQL